MLETKIDELIKVVTALTAQLADLKDSSPCHETETKKPTPKKKPAPKKKPVETEEVEEVEETEVSAIDIRKAAQKKIAACEDDTAKKTFGSFLKDLGVKKLVDVDASDFADLMERIENEM